MFISIPRWIVDGGGCNLRYDIFMTPEQRKVAEAAILTPRATNILQLESNVASAVGMDAFRVKGLLGSLVEEGYLKVGVTPAVNLAAGDPIKPNTMVWYERQRDWPQ